MNQKHFFKYSDADWPFVRRYFDEHGKINFNKTITQLNEFIKDSGYKKVYKIKNDVDT